jgi:DNA polymerase III subunit delta'
MARAPAAAEIEAPPEDDRLEGLPHPRETVRLLGHASAEAELAEAFAQGRTHHAWLITGREGIGKATLAYRLAAYIMAGVGERHASGRSLDVDRNGPTARHIRAQAHPGLLVIRRPYDHKLKRLMTAITVDEVRRIRDFLHLSGEGNRVVIVDSADEMNLNAANALLKSLEEPPARTTFLVLSARPGRLLATIRSRCRRLDLHGLPDADLRAAAAAALGDTTEPKFASGPAPERTAKSFAEQLVHLAEGSVRRLVVLEAKGGLALHDRIVALVEALPRVEWGAIHKLGDEISGTANDERFELVIALLLDIIAATARAAATGAHAPVSASALDRLTREGRLASLAGVWETLLAEAGEARALNLDRKTLLIETFARLSSLAH